MPLATATDACSAQEHAHAFVEEGETMRLRLAQIDGVFQDAHQAMHSVAQGLVRVFAGVVTHAHAAPMRARASVQYSGSSSSPMNEKPSNLAAHPVEPLPQNGSSTTPPGGVTRRTR